MERKLEPELLDSLPPDDPAAMANRRDLRVVNRLMGNHRWFASTLGRHLRPGEPVLEIGAGTGELGLALARRGIAVDGLDLWPRPPGWPAGSRWFREDLRGFGGYARYPVVIGNLIFHQFDGGELGAIGARLAGARLIVANEPSRRRLSQWICAALAPLVGAHAVSRHDARVSIAGGFRGRELPLALGLAEGAWRATCRTNAIGAYRMVAWRAS